MSSNLKSIAVPTKRRQQTAAANSPTRPTIAYAAPSAPSPAAARQTAHLYTVGERLMLLSNIRVGKAASACLVLRLLPFEGREFQYRVQDEADGRERVVAETDLRAA